MPGFRLSAPAGTEALTARHLLTHAGSIDGNHFIDLGRNDDAIGKLSPPLLMRTALSHRAPSSPIPTAGTRYSLD